MCLFCCCCCCLWVHAAQQEVDSISFEPFAVFIFMLFASFSSPLCLWYLQFSCQRDMRSCIIICEWAGFFVPPLWISLFAFIYIFNMRCLCLQIEKKLTKSWQIICSTTPLCPSVSTYCAFSLKSFFYSMHLFVHVSVVFFIFFVISYAHLMTILLVLLLHECVWTSEIIRFSLENISWLAQLVNRAK